MRRNIYIVVFCLLSTVYCFGQKNTVDSLLHVLQTTKYDTTKVNTLNNLFLEYEFTDAEKAKEYLNKALVLSQKVNYKKGLAITYLHLGYFAEDNGNYPEALKNYFASLKIRKVAGDKKGISDSYNNIGNVYYNKGNYPEALNNYFASMKIREAMGDKKGVAASYGNIGSAYYNQGNYPEALKSHLASLKIREKIGDHIGIPSSYGNIGNVYYAQGSYQEALKYHLISLKRYEAMGEKKGIADSYNNIGNVYYNQAKLERTTTLRESKLDLALNNYLASLKMSEAIGNNAGIASSYNNIGGVYSDQGNFSQASLMERNQSFELALKNYFSCLKIMESIGNKAGISASFNNIGYVFTKQKKYIKAEEYLIKAKELSTEIGYKECLKNTYSSLKRLDSTKGNYKGAYENHKLFILYSDSLDNEETRKKTIQTQMTYDFEKKEAIATAEHKMELESQGLIANEKNRKQKVIIAFVVFGLLLVIVFAAFIFRSLRITRKQKNIIEKQKSVVEQQKLQVEHQKLIVEEHQKEIIDSITYARRIQQSLLPTEKYIDNCFKRLMKVK